MKSHGFIIISQLTGHKIYWEDWHKWKEIEDTPEYIRTKEYTHDELKTHNMAASKWSRMALNSPTQGTGACIIKLATYKFFKWIVDNNLFEKVLICDIVHDELVVEFPKELENSVVTTLVSCMESAASKFCKSLPIPAEAEVGDGWIH